MSKEIWKDIEGYEGFYQISNLGNVRSLDRKAWNGSVIHDVSGRILKTISVGDYQGVQLSKKGEIKKKYIHRLVAIAFVENPKNKRVVNHMDGDKKNNAVSNLEWCTPKENNDHAFKTGLRPMYGEKSPAAKFSDDLVTSMRSDYETGLYTQKSLAEKYGMSKMQAHRILKNKLRVNDAYQKGIVKNGRVRS